MKLECNWSQEEVLELRRCYMRMDKPVALAALAVRLGRNKPNVCRKARSLGLTNQRRAKAEERSHARDRKFNTQDERNQNQSKIMKDRIAKNGHPKGYLGLRHSVSTKAVIAAKSKSMWESMTPCERDNFVLKMRLANNKPATHARTGATWKAGWREIGSQRCYFRSRWEANYARYLEWLCTLGHFKKWEHEPHTFWFEGIKRGCVSYLPDFRVTKCDDSTEWHEVKGWMDARSKTVLARMAKYHPQEKVIVIREKQYIEIKKKVSALIPGWEAGKV